MYFRKYLFSIVALLSVASIFAMKETTVEIITGPTETLKEISGKSKGETMFALSLEGNQQLESFRFESYISNKFLSRNELINWGPIRKNIFKLPEKLRSEVKEYKDPKNAQGFYDSIINEMQKLSKHVKKVYEDFIQPIEFLCFLREKEGGFKLRQVPYIPLLHTIITQTKKEDHKRLIKVLIPGPGEMYSDHTEILPQFTEILKDLGFSVKRTELEQESMHQ